MTTASKTKSYAKLIEEAMKSLQEIDLQLNDPLLKTGRKRYKGTTIHAVTKFIIENNDFTNETRAKGAIKVATKKLINNSSILKITGTPSSLTGRFKLAEPTIKPAEARKRKGTKSSEKKTKSSKAGSDDSEENSEGSHSPPPKPKPKGKLKVESNVVKKTKAGKKIADLTKPPPPSKGTKQPAKPKETKAGNTKKPTKPTIDPIDEILGSDKENTPLNIIKPKTKATAKKTEPKKKVVKKTAVRKKPPPSPTPGSSGATFSDNSDEDSDAPMPVKKAPPKGKAKAAPKNKKKLPLKVEAVFSDFSESQSADSVSEEGETN